MSAPSLEEARAALEAQQAELEAAGVNIAKAKRGIEAAWGSVESLSSSQRRRGV
jgi:hypothetical protein